MVLILETMRNMQKPPENWDSGSVKVSIHLYMEVENPGLMGAVAKEVHAAGSEVIGVIPGNVEFIKSRPQPYVTKLITTTNMS